MAKRTLRLLVAAGLAFASGCAGVADRAARPAAPEPSAYSLDSSPVKVQIARWTPPDIPEDERTTSTIWSGDLIIDDGCLALTDPQSNLLLVFPYGVGEWDDNAQTLTYEGDRYQLGDDLLLMGGWAPRGSYKLGDGKQSIPDCKVERLFLIDWVRRSN